MPNPNESFAHGEHNDKACEILRLKEFPDWTITTAFYAALHFVSSKIFPFEKEFKGNKLKFIDLPQYQSFKQKQHNKHELLCNLVHEFCEEIHPEYEWLLSASYTARYRSYNHSPEIVNRSVDYMGRIKKYCKPK